MVMALRQDKKGIFRTMEAFIAIFISFLFLIIFLPQQREQASVKSPPDVLAGFSGNDDFRGCVIIANYTCLNQTIARQLGAGFDFKTNISERVDSAIFGLPQKRIYSNSIFIAGNTTNTARKIVRLYYWQKK